MFQMNPLLGMKNQALFSLKDKSKKKLKCHLLQFLFGALRVVASQTIILGAIFVWGFKGCGISRIIIFLNS